MTYSQRISMHHMHGDNHREILFRSMKHWFAPDLIHAALLSALQPHS